jgi:hypothetical protein
MDLFQENGFKFQEKNQVSGNFLQFDENKRDSRKENMIWKFHENRIFLLLFC